MTGDSARLDRAKTIDLCQNPLTVRATISSMLTLTDPVLRFARKNRSWRGPDKSQSGLCMITRLLSLHVASPTLANCDRGQSPGLWMPSRVLAKRRLLTKKSWEMYPLSNQQSNMLRTKNCKPLLETDLLHKYIFPSVLSSYKRLPRIYDHLKLLGSIIDGSSTLIPLSLQSHPISFSLKRQTNCMCVS